MLWAQYVSQGMYTSLYWGYYTLHDIKDQPSQGVLGCFLDVSGAMGVLASMAFAFVLDLF